MKAIRDGKEISVDKEELLKKYADNLAKSKNKNHYLSYARQFLDSVDELDKASIDKYIERLHKKKFSPGTVNFAFRIIRRLFKVNNLDWEYRLGEAPVIGQRDEYRPQLSSRIIEMMVEAAKNGKLFPDEQCFLALSTIYGLRRQEMVSLETKDIDLKAGSIFIGTVKRGRQRYHLIPAEILPFLEEHDFSQRYGLATLTQMFKRILLKSGVQGLKTDRLGWHSIRRALLDGLINNDVNLLATRNFLRWKGAAGDLAMPARYYGNVIVDIGHTEPVLEEAKGDEDIFQKHPFLPLWQRTHRPNGEED